jgi:hypothetical protein
MIMKLLIFTIATSLFSVPLLKGQDTLKRVYVGVDLACVRPDVFKKDGFFPSLTVSSGKHVVFAGPSLVYYDQYHPRGLWGAQAGYRLFPNKHYKRFNLFFEYNVNFVKGKLIDNYRSFGWFNTESIRTINLVALDNYFGFGFRINLFKNLYLSSNIGFDLGFYKEEYSYEYPNGAKWGSSGHLRLRNLSDRNKIFKIGIGYDLFRLKKKK